MLLALIRLALRVFYRRIAYVGLDRVPPRASALFVLNHPNALVDPLFILDAVRRPVHFLAKAPLFRVPVFGAILRAVGGLPVFRAQDGADTKQNEQTFRECFRVLARGESVAIFPEGTTHSEAGLKPMKTGAARIALGAEAAAAFGLGVQIVPVGLQYEAKETFRSNVTVWFGAPHGVTDLATLYAATPADAVLEETRRLGAALHEVTLNVGRQDLLDLIAATEIYAGGERVGAERAAALRRQFSEAYAWVIDQVPDRLARLRRALARDARVLRRLGLRPRDLEAGGPSGASLLLRLLAAVPFMLMAAVGVICEWVPYQVVDAVARRRASTGLELAATTKVVAAILVYPLWWMVTALAVWYAVGGWTACLVLAAHPVVSYLAMTALERLDRVRRRLQMFRLAARPRRLARLRQHQHAIREELAALNALHEAQRTLRGRE